MLKSEAILSLPIDVHMAGFQSNTFALQNAGWELAADQDIRYQKLWILIRHPMWKLAGFSQPIDFDYFYYAQASRFSGARIDIKSLRSQDSFRFVEVNSNISSFLPIDATPEFVYREEKSLMDFKIFKTIDHMKDIVVEPSSVPELMEHILRLQSPKQAEIRERVRKEKAREDFWNSAEPSNPEVVQAQVITMCGAA